MLSSHPTNPEPRCSVRTPLTDEEKARRRLALPPGPRWGQPATLPPTGYPTPSFSTRGRSVSTSRFPMFGSPKVPALDDRRPWSCHPARAGRGCWTSSRRAISPELAAPSLRPAPPECCRGKSDGFCRNTPHRDREPGRGYASLQGPADRTMHAHASRTLTTAMLGVLSATPLADKKRPDGGLRLVGPKVGATCDPPANRIPLTFFRYSQAILFDLPFSPCLGRRKSLP